MQRSGLSDFGGRECRFTAERDDFIAEILRVKVRLRARGRKKRRKILPVVALHQRLLIHVLNGGGVFQRQGEIESFQQLLIDSPAVSVAVSISVSVFFYLRLLLCFAHKGSPVTCL